jgi:hypothetical protein
MDITKMPEHMKENFEDPSKMFTAPLKVWEFQQKQMHNMTKNTRDYVSNLIYNTN